MKYLSEISDVGKPVEILRTGTWDYYGQKMVVTKETLENMVKNFKEGIRPEPPTQLVIDYNHGSEEKDPELSKAAGWLKDLYVEGDKLFMIPQWTENARNYIQNKEFRYVSPEYAEHYRDKKTGNDVGPTLLAVAITNRPYLEGQEGITLAEKEELHKQAEARSKKYHIHVRKDGNLTIPSEYKDCPEGDFADPVNYMYPCNTEERAIAASKYFSKEKNRSFYSPEEQKIIEGRIKKHLPERMKKNAFKGGKMEEKVDRVVELTEKIAEKDRILAEKEKILSEQEGKIKALTEENKKLKEGLQLAEANEWVEKSLSEHKILPTEKETLTKLYVSNKKLAEELIEKRGVIVPKGVKGEDISEQPDKVLNEIEMINKYQKEHNIKTFAEARIEYEKAKEGK